MPEQDKYEQYDSRILLSRKDRAEIRRRREKRSKHGDPRKLFSRVLLAAAGLIYFFSRLKSIGFRKWLSRAAIIAAIFIVGVAAIYGISRFDYSGSVKSLIAKVAEVGNAIPWPDSQDKNESLNKVGEKGALTGAAHQKEPGITSCLIVGASGPRGKEEAVGIYLIVLDEKNNELSAVTIPPNVFVNIPGLGYDKLSMALRLGGMKRTVSAVKNFLSIPIDHYSKILNQDFEALAAADGFSEMITKSIETDLSSKEKIDFAYRLSKIGPSRIEVTNLPGKRLDMGADEYFEVQKAQAEFLVKNIYDMNTEGREPVVRIQVLNGCGLPGSTGPVQEKLIDAGFRVEESKNADHFGYQTTVIVTYMDDTKAAYKIRKVLGAGDVIQKRGPQELIDVIVIIGKDIVPGA